MSYLPKKGIIGHQLWQRWIFIILHHYQHYGVITVSDVGTTYVDISNYRHIPIDFTNVHIAKLGIIASVVGNEVGTKGIRIYNVTDAAEIASATWSGTTRTIVSAFGDTRSLTGNKEIDIEWKGSSATEDMSIYWLILVIELGRG